MRSCYDWKKKKEFCPFYLYQLQLFTVVSILLRTLFVADSPLDLFDHTSGYRTPKNNHSAVVAKEYCLSLHDV